MSSQPSPTWRFHLGAALLFGAACVLVGNGIAAAGLGTLTLETALAFVAFGLLTIACGFPHPHYGHVSFDRVAQFSSLLIFGPVAAALVNMVASLVYPWHRLRQGQTVGQVLSAALANAGMMGLILLASGWVYQNLGGAVPLSTFDAAVLPPLLAMAITAHLLNDAIMAALYALRGGRARELFSLFPTVVEWVSFLVAILVAIFYNTARGTGEIVLALLVLLLGMIAVRRLALLRQSLEQQVAERTRELREKTVELDRLVQEDVLTGLKNRRHLDQRLGPELQRAIRYGRALSVAIGDLDHFKRINDEYSHAAGDEALRQVAQILRRSARESDIVARYGGEEFVLCLPETDGAQALALCERLRQEIASHDWSTISPGLRVTISFGIAVLAPRIIDPDRLMAEADHCLYAAKRAGRNRVIAAAEAGAAPA